MEFIRNNILKIVTFVIALIVAIVVLCLFLGNKTDEVDTYSEMETSLVNATKEYINNNSKLKPNEGETSKINLDTLENEEYIDPLYAFEDENVKCSGYVEISLKDESYSYVPYIKCGNYYETTTIADYIKNNSEIVTSGDGLYQSGEKYIYKGEEPNNYLVLGERVYRVIEITENNELRLISTEMYSTELVWDNRYNSEIDDNYGINDYSKSRIKDSLESLYEESEFFSDFEKEKIVEHNVCIGKRSLSDLSMDGSTECSSQVSQMVSLIQANEFARASVDDNCEKTSSKSCLNYNYFTNITSSYMTITAVADNTYQIYYLSSGVLRATIAYSSFYVYPIVYINDTSLYSSGSGTQEDPYMVR